MILAVSDNGIIGHNGDLPWHLSDELKRFRKITTGHAILMGRKTHESIGRALPDRRNIVITRQRDYQPLDAAVEIAHDVDAAIALASTDRNETELFIIGGATIYESAWPRVDRLYLTRVHGQFEGDTYWPPPTLDFDLSDWTCRATENHPIDAKHAHAYTCETHDRLPPPHTPPTHTHVIPHNPT